MVKRRTVIKYFEAHGFRCEAVLTDKHFIPMAEGRLSGDIAKSITTVLKI